MVVKISIMEVIRVLNHKEVEPEEERLAASSWVLHHIIARAKPIYTLSLIRVHKSSRRGLERIKMETSDIYNTLRESSSAKVVLQNAMNSYSVSQNR